MKLNLFQVMSVVGSVNDSLLKASADGTITVIEAIDIAAQSAKAVASTMGIADKPIGFEDDPTHGKDFHLP